VGKMQNLCNAKDSSTCSQRWCLNGWSTGWIFPTNTDVNMYRWCTFMLTLLTYNIQHTHSYDCLREQLSGSDQVVGKNWSSARSVRQSIKSDKWKDHPPPLQLALKKNHKYLHSGHFGHESAITKWNCYVSTWSECIQNKRKMTRV
jgi:hypothetical protein